MMEKPQTYYYSNNALDIPLIRYQVSEAPLWIAPYRYRIRDQSIDFADGAVHFFIDDRRFEVAYNKPLRVLKTVQAYGMAFTPDFSVFIGMPRALQIYNIYRSRWVGAYWQHNGLTVVPTITWGDESTYDFCYLGIEKGSTVALSSVGAGDEDTFSPGYREMVARLDPRQVLIFGSLPDDLQSLVEYTSYPSDKWKQGRIAMRKD